MNLIERVKNILMTPKTEWDVIDQETTTPQPLVMGYVLPLVGVGTIATFLGWTLIGKTYYGFKIAGIELGIRYGLITLVSGIAAVFLTGFVIDALATNFKSEKNLSKSLQLAAYSFTPGWVAAILNIIPSIGAIAGLAGIYGLYLMYIGLAKMKKTPEDQVTTYFVASLITMIVASLLITYLLTMIFIPSLSLDSFNFKY